MVDASQSSQQEMDGSGDGRDIPLSDNLLLDLLDALVNDLGKVAAAEALGVNYRTLSACYDSRHVSWRMRRALEEYRDTAVGDGDDLASDDVVDVSEKLVALEELVMALEKENRALKETTEAQAEQLAQLERQVGAPGEEERQQVEAHASQANCGLRKQWRPPRRDHGLPDTGVVTLEEQPDEEHAFGPAAPLVAEWRGLRTADGTTGGRVDRAGASVRRWELEVAMIGDFGLTLPPEPEPLDASRRDDHLRWRREALAAARRELAGARRLRLLRRILTLGLWWR